MQVFNLNDYYKGWFIGNFEPTLLKTKFFEVSIQTYKKGEFVQPHTHKIVTEYNVVIEGSMTIQGTILRKNDIFILHPDEKTDPVYHEDCTLLIVKVPSAPDDKHLL